jgi:hypothetical protein
MDTKSRPISPVSVSDAGAFLSLAARLLYANGQATRSVIAPVERVGRSVDYSVVLSANGANSSSDSERSTNPVMDAGSGGDMHLLMATFVDGATAGAILLAMALGLSLPKLLLEGLVPTLAGLPKE